jgi:hypothetical protein
MNDSHVASTSIKPKSTQIAPSRRHVTISNSSATTISTIGQYHASQLTGTNTDDTENDAEDDNGDDDDVTSIASASTVPPSLIDGMSKYFTPASRQRKHSSEQMEVSLLKVVSKLNKSMESNKSDASSSHKSTTSAGGIKKKQTSSSLAKRKTHENGDDDDGVRVSGGGGGGDVNLNANLNNSDKENQTKQQQQQPHLSPLEPPSHQPQIRFEINVDNIKRESSVEGKKSQKNQKSKSNINETDKSIHPGIYMNIFYSFLHVKYF